MRASIIIPTFNSAKTLPETLNSIIPQLSLLDEVVIVDDGSNDNTQDVVEGYLSANIRYFHQSNSGGPAAPRNVGVKESRGELIFLFDSDDLMLPGKLDAALKAYEMNPDVGMIFSNFRTIDESGALLKRGFLDDYELAEKLHQLALRTQYRIESPLACLHLARENFVGTSGVAIPSSVFREVGMFDETLRNGDDRDMWFRITRNYPVVYLPQEYHCYRIRANSISMGNAEKRVWSKLKVLERQLENPVNNEFSRDIRHLISENYRSLAYEAFVHGNMGISRQYLRSAMARERNWQLFQLYAKTLLGAKMSSFIRKMKNW